MPPVSIESVKNIETPAEYDAYVSQVFGTINALSFLSTGTAGDHCADHECGPHADEGHFSWSPCDVCCRELGGQRYPAHFVGGTSGAVRHLNICADCVYFIEYGRLDDETMARVDDARAVESLADELDRDVPDRY